MHRRQLVADHVRRPVLRHAGADQAVERLRRAPHHVGADVVVLGLGQRARAFLDQRLQDALGEAVLDAAFGGIGQVLLDRVDEGVDDAVGDLARRQRVGGRRVEHREHRIGEGREEGQLVAGLPAADDGAVVGLGAGGRQRQHDAHLHRVGDLGAAGQQDLPGIRRGLVARGRGDELGPVRDRAAAHGQQEVDALGLDHLDGLHQRLEGGIGLDAGELEHRAAGQRRADLVEHAVLLDAAAAVGDQDARVGGNLLPELGDLALAEEDLGGGVEDEVVHGLRLRGGDRRIDSMGRIVPPAPRSRQGTKLLSSCPFLLARG